jgi:hypothetical protein
MKAKLIYFIRPIGMRSPIKIGCSYSPDGRRSTLDTWAPFPLEIVAEIEGGFKMERQFHAMFAHLHERREWFSSSVELEAVIAAINAGTFDTAALPEPMRLKAAARAKKTRTPDQRLGMSYAGRFRWVEKSQGLHYICDPNPCQIVSTISKGGCSPETIARADDMIANPRRYCETKEEYSRRMAEWRERYDAWRAHCNAVQPAMPPRPEPIAASQAAA